MYCTHCGTNIHDDAAVCVSCGRATGSAIKSAKPSNKWSHYWLLIILAILIPITGVIMGVIGLIIGKEDSGTLIFVGVMAWLLFGVLMLGGC